MLKRGRADQALIQLRNALNLYTAAKNNSGIAAAHNELGNLYLRQDNTRSRSTIIKRRSTVFSRSTRRKQRLMRWSGWATTSSTQT